MKELYVIVNEKINNNKNFISCENKDIQSIINFLSHKFKLILFSRNSNFKKPFKLIGNFKIFIFNFKKILKFFFLFSRLKKNKKLILIISITPFNFMIFFLFKFFHHCKFYLYLRSNGYEEYENIFGKNFIWIYNFMYKYMVKSCRIISCHQRLYKKNCHIVYPSELTDQWNKNIRKNFFYKNFINILYVGRFKVEKGIYSLLDLFSKLPNNIKLTMVGEGDKIQNNNSNIKIINFINKEKELINIYDTSNIIILPSYTEAHPKVLDEALSRLKPVIIFSEIRYVINGRLGVFCTKRRPEKLSETIYYIVNNYNKIRNDIKKNVLPTRKIFLDSLFKIINND